VERELSSRSPIFPCQWGLTPLPNEPGSYWITKTLKRVSTGVLEGSKQAISTNRSLAPVLPHEMMSQIRSVGVKRDDTRTVSVAPPGRARPAKTTRYWPSPVLRALTNPPDELMRNSEKGV